MQVSLVTIGEVLDSLGNIRLTHEAVLAAEALAYPGPFVASSAKKSAANDEGQSIVSERVRHFGMNGGQKEEADFGKRDPSGKELEIEMDEVRSDAKGAAKGMDHASDDSTQNGQKMAERSDDALGSELQRRLEEHERRHTGNGIVEQDVSADGRDSDGSDMAISASDGQELVKDALLEGPSGHRLSEAAESEMGAVGQRRASMQDEDEVESRRVPDNADEVNEQPIFIFQSVDWINNF